MHRIDGANATVDNKFSLGNPGAGIPATTVTADILNALQEEVCGVIEASGITLNKSNNAQLLEAIRRLTVSTGDVKLTIKTAADPGWIMCNDGTIGSAASGATTRAHMDTEALYTLLWNNISNTYAPVTGGRGATAAADFAANKPIALAKMLGRALAVAGSGTGLTARALGQTVGAETHVLTASEMPSHAHGVNDPSHTHTGNNGVNKFVRWANGADAPFDWNSLSSGAEDGEWGSIANAATGISIQAAGGGAAHNNMPPESFLNAMIKL